MRSRLVVQTRCHTFWSGRCCLPRTLNSCYCSRNWQRVGRVLKRPFATCPEPGFGSRRTSYRAVRSHIDDAPTGVSNISLASDTTKVLPLTSVSRRVCLGTIWCADHPLRASRAVRTGCESVSVRYVSLRIATARVHPADAACTLTGKQHTSNPLDGSASRLLNFSIWQYPISLPAL